VSGIIGTPPAVMPGVYAIPPYAKQVTVVWPVAVGIAILALLDRDLQVVSLCPFSASIVPVAIQGRDYYAVPESVRWWALAMTTPQARGDHARVIWELHV
jgi:hypothetical protein